MAEAKTKTKKKATEEKEETPVVEMENPMTEEDQAKAQQLAWQEHMKERSDARAKCGEEINEILEKYGCEMTAQMLINEHKTVPQVFIIDKRKSAER